MRLRALILVLFLCTLSTYAQTPSGGYSSPSVGSSSSSGSAAPNQNSIYLSQNCGTQTNCVTIPASGGYTCLANFSTSNGTLTDASTDAPWTSAMVGWQIFVTNGACQFLNGSTTGTVGYSGTISAVGGAHTLTLAGTPSINCTSSTTTSCRAYWFPSDSATALNAAWQAATLTKGNCQTLVLPGGVYKFNTSILETGDCGVQAFLATATADNGPTVVGQGMGTTILVADPAFNGNTCTSQGGGCVFGTPANATGVNISNLTITGGGNATVANGNGKCKLAVVGVSWEDNISNVFLDYWGYATSGFTGICWVGTPQGVSSIDTVYVFNGGNGCIALTGNVVAKNLFCFTPGGSTINGQNNYTFGSQFFGGGSGGYTITLTNGTASCATVNGYANDPTWVSNGDQIWGSSNNGAINDAIACPVIVENDFITSTFGVNVAIGSSGTAALAKFHAKNTVFGGGVTDIGGTQAGSALFDDGGNSFTGSNTMTNVLVYGDNSITGSPSVTGNWVLTSGWSSSTTGTFTGRSRDGGLTITLAGTPSTGAVLTFTFPQPFLAAPTHCSWVETGGTQILTSVATTSISATAVSYTFAGTLAAASTITGYSSCGNG